MNRITNENLLTLKRGDRITFKSSYSYGTDQLATVTENFLPDEELEESGHLYFIEDSIPDMEFELYYEELLKYSDTTYILDETKADIDSLIESLPKRGRLFHMYNE